MPVLHLLVQVWLAEDYNRKRISYSLCQLMLDDNLRQPLQRKNWRDRLRPFSPTPLRIATAAVLLSAFTLVTWLTHIYDPEAGEPVVHLEMQAADPVQTASIPPTALPETDSTADTLEDGAVDFSGEAANPGEELETTETESAVIIAPPIKLMRAPAKGFVETGPDGPLPKRGADGRRPSEIYARPVHKAVLQSSQPKIAILLGGMGLNSDLTNRAIRDLPGEVTLAFAPYGQKLQKTIDQARAQGHEVMLQLPMEPFGHLAHNSPGPHTLLVSANQAGNETNLSWLLSRFTGYTGVVNYLGARFTSDAAALTPVMRALNHRGLVYLDDGSSSRSVASEVGEGLDLPVRQATLVIDGRNDFNSITASLRKLEELAAGGRVVIGIGTGLPATIDAVANWAKNLENRRIFLVPVSAGFQARPG